MSSPVRVTQGTTCAQLPDAINSDMYTDDLKFNFERDINYAEVYKNFNTDTFYKVWIDRSELDSKLDGKTIMTSYPYDTVQFQTGDYITWNDDNFMIVALEGLRYYEVVGRIMQCTQSLNRYDNDGNLIKKLTPFFSNKGGGETDDKNIKTATGSRYAWLPQDSDVSEWVDDLNTDERMVLFYIPNERKVYKLIHIDASESDTICLMEFEVYESPVNIDKVNNTVEPQLDQTFTLIIDQLDLSLSISDTIQLSETIKNGLGDIVSKDVIWTSDNELIATVDSTGLVTGIANGTASITCQMTNNASVNDSIDTQVSATIVDDYQYIITPNSTTLNYGAFVEYSIELVNNGVAVVETFDINISGDNLVNNANYYFEQKTNDTFWIENKQGLSTPITISLDSVTYSDTISITLQEI